MRTSRSITNYKDPYSHEVIFSVEQQLMSNLGLQVNYVHKAGYDYPGWQDIGGQYAQVPYADSERCRSATNQR